MDSAGPVDVQSAARHQSIATQSPAGDIHNSSIFHQSSIEPANDGQCTIRNAG